jgi:hypothetical protein
MWLFRLPPEKMKSNNGASWRRAAEKIRPSFYLPEVREEGRNTKGRKTNAKAVFFFLGTSFFSCPVGGMLHFS